MPSLRTPSVSVDVLAVDWADAVAQLLAVAPTDDLRIFSGDLRQSRGRWTGTLQAFVFGLEPPAGARWVLSDRWHPAPDITLRFAAADAVDATGILWALFAAHRLRDLRLDIINSDPIEYQATAKVQLLSGRYGGEVTMRGPRGGIGL